MHVQWATIITEFEDTRSKTLAKPDANPKPVYFLEFLYEEVKKGEKARICVKFERKKPVKIFNLI